MRNQLVLEVLLAMQPFRQTLCANGTILVSTHKEIGTVWVSLDATIKDASNQRGDGNPVIASHLHVFLRNVDRVSTNPLFLHVGDFVGSAHRSQLKEKHISNLIRRKFDDSTNDERDFVPRQTLHRLGLWTRKNPRYPRTWIVRDVTRANGKVEHFTQSHENALECCLFTTTFEFANCLNHQGRVDLRQKKMTQGSHDIALHSRLFVFVGLDGVFLRLAPQFERILHIILLVGEESRCLNFLRGVWYGGRRYAVKGELVCVNREFTKSIFGQSN